MTAQPLSGITAMKGLLNAMTIGWMLLLSGCAGVFLLGAGVGAGAFSYIAGNLTRVYEAEYQQSIQASINALEQHNFKSKEESADGLKTTIEGNINFDTPVTIEVVPVDSGWTQIGVRTGYVGSDNLEMSEQVHTDIAKELQRLKPRSLQATSQKKKLNEPRTLRATSQKKKVKPTESKPRISQTLYETLPPPPKNTTTSTTGITEDTQSIDTWQENQAADPTDRQQDKPTDDNAKGSKNKRDVPPLISDTVSAPLESDLADTQKMSGRQEKQAIQPPESKDKKFIYYPKSALTIHSGSYGALDDVISYLDKNPYNRVDIRAYTDSSGDFTRNLDLSRKRVSEIRNYLILHDISEEIITTQELGATKSPDSKGTEGLRSLNHSVEITIR